MDARPALPEGTTLRFGNGCEYTVTGELARGGTSIVYNAYYCDNLGERKNVRIKECCPFKCRLKRGCGGELLVPPGEEKLFSETRERMLRAYRLGNGFFRRDGLTNLTANTYNIFEANNTLYIVSAYAQGQELSYERYPSVRDSIAAVKSAADAIRRIHDEGWLYLDIKPGNILTLEGTTELVQLFDFDTVVPVSDAAGLGDKLSYTRGFAALELRAGDPRRIGRHTDVYGIGALLYYMLFDRVPDAFDCEAGAEYDFSRSKLSGGSYQDALVFRLTDFFHHTLADFYPDRFSDMRTVVERLSELQQLADCSARYVVSSRICEAGVLLGRTEEIRWITRRFTGGGCCFVTGMGGIGKSTLLRHCIRRCGEKLDSVLYLNYLGSIEKTICDDYAVRIHSVQRDKSETESGYFDRKLGILRELGRGKSCLLVMDNFTGDSSGALPKLLQTGWTLIFAARDASLSAGFERLELGPLSQESELKLFAKNLGRELTDQERGSASSIIRSVGGHTLVIELIAKQIGSPVCGLSIEQAAELAAAKGFSGIAAEEVGYQKDSVPRHDTIQRIISGLFEAESLAASQRVLLKVLSLFGQTGVSADRLCEMLELESKEDIRRLYGQGWIYVEDTILTMHPVIEEVVSNWELSQAAWEAAERVLLYLDIRLRVEAEKEEYPKDLLRCLQKVREASPGSRLDRRLRKTLSRKGSGRTKEVWTARVKGSGENLAADPGQRKEILLLAMAALEGGKREPKIRVSDIYGELLFYTIKNTPYENEDYLREKAQEYLTLFRHKSERMTLIVCQELLEGLYDHGEFEEAERRIRQARKGLSRNLSPDVWGRYYYLLAGYYDALLGGGYDGATPGEARLVRLLLNAVGKAIRCLTLSGAGDAGVFLGECCRLKALVLIRSGLGKKKQVHRILEKVRRLIDKYAQPNSRLVRDYDLTLAWYHTYLDEDLPKTRAHLFKAYEITDIISTSELARIDDQLSPMANILLEWQRYDEAAMYLLRAILSCANHPELPAYARRQAELLGYLLEVYLQAGEYSKCQAVIDKLDEKVEKIGTLEIRDYVPEEIRKAVAEANEVTMVRK